VGAALEEKGEDDGGRIENGAGAAARGTRGGEGTE